jgi:DNA mismatch repair ATPase MutS
MESPAAYYREQSAHYTKLIAQAKERYVWIAVLRLVSFIAFLFTTFQWINAHSQVLLVLSVVFQLVFIVLVRIAVQLNERKALLEKLLFINNNETAVLQYQPNQFNSGSQIVSGDDHTADLDVFGANSLFHLLNRTTTHHGMDQLAGLLREPLMNREDIEAYQAAIQTLSRQAELRQLITAHGLLHQESEGNLHQIVSWVQTPPILLNRKWINILRFVIPLINLVLLGYYLATDIYYPLVLGILSSWMVIGVFAQRVNRQHSLLGKKQTILEQYAAVLTDFTQVDTGASALLQREQALASAAHKAIKKLSRLASFFDQRLNFLVNMLLNSFFLYDIQCLRALEQWKAQYRNHFNEWIHCVGMIETLNSLATFAYNFPSFHYPTVLEKSPVITATALAHPLIPEQKRVANDCHFGQNEKLVLVTGSNMSGKTTFLRALGVNLLLARCGAPVCASSFAFTPMHIRSSIRVNDSLQEHTSYFMAELKRLQHIVVHLQQSPVPTLVLIDEILRGTNSEDKTHGSEQFIKKLIQYNCLTLFATHDLALSRLEQELPGQVRNYCFESTIQNGELLFDYKLRTGVAKNRNASFLMEKMQII